MTIIKNTYPWDSFPQIRINAAKLDSPRNIYDIFKLRKIDKYLYKIEWKNKDGKIVVLKYGMSAPRAKSRDWGERLYRQVGHARSWGEDRISGSSGSDWLEIEADVLKAYNQTIDHKDLILTVWDVTKYDFVSFFPWQEVEKMESELINNYVAIHGEKPIGNINDESYKMSRVFASKKVVENLFEVV